MLVAHSHCGMGTWPASQRMQQWQLSPGLHCIYDCLCLRALALSRSDFVTSAECLDVSRPDCCMQTSRTRKWAQAGVKLWLAAAWGGPAGHDLATKKRLMPCWPLSRLAEAPVFWTLLSGRTSSCGALCGASSTVPAAVLTFSLAPASARPVV